MISHLDRYMAGSAFFVATIYLKGGRRVAIFDRTIRWRAAARSLRREGLTVGQIARRVGRKTDAVERVLRASFPRCASGWKISNFGVD